MKYKYKVSRAKALLAYKLLTVDGCSISGVSVAMGLPETALLRAIRREIDPNYSSKRGVPVKKSRTLTPDEWEFAKQFIRKPNMQVWKAVEILAKKFNWSKVILHSTLSKCDSYSEAMEFAKNFSFAGMSRANTIGGR